MYNVKLEQFEGPLDLLLNLISKEELDITGISLAQVTDQYLDYLERKEEINLANLSDFLTVASKLILIKSKALLPLLTLNEEEEEEIADLAQQIVEYKKFKDVALKLKERMLKNRIAYSREVFYEIKPKFSLPKNIDLEKLKVIYDEILSQIPVMDKLEEERMKKVVSLREKIDNLKTLLEKRAKTTFRKLLSHKSGKKADKAEVIVSFLAMLEMVKRRIVAVEQKDIFYDIEISLKN